MNTTNSDSAIDYLQRDSYIKCSRSQAARTLVVLYCIVILRMPSVAHSMAIAKVSLGT